MVDSGRLVMSIPRNQDGNWPADGLLRSIAKEELCAAVPAYNEPVRVFGQDRVDRRFDNRGIVLSRAFAT
jgi:hypothetical protein